MWRRFASPFALSSKGIMGMNRRNISYISRYNPRRLYPLVDNKLKTKIIAQNKGVTTPQLLGVVQAQHDISSIASLLPANAQFVIKPAKGSGGKGILVITAQQNGRFIKPSGQECTLEDIQRHCSNILAGLFSLGGRGDVALIEALIQFDDCFDGFSFEGVPDVRVIVLQGYPVMAMMRLSTAASDGKANLHQGAVGVGIDIRSGRALRAVQFGQPVQFHPDTQRPLQELIVPHWSRLLELAASCYEMSGLGYIGTDMVIDREQGPMLLELNARPGLAIQVANGEGLLPRLRLVEKHLASKASLNAKQRVAWSIEHITPNTK